MNDYFASNPSEDSALLYALAIGAGIWLASYLWKQYHKPNKSLPPLNQDRKAQDNKGEDDMDEG
ncbi:MAG: hypothetical protein R8M46_08810 [Ghiorsea sp.]